MGLELLNIDHDPIRDMYGEKFCNGFFGKKEGCNREDFVILSLVYNKYYFMVSFTIIREIFH